MNDKQKHELDKWLTLIEGRALCGQLSLVRGSKGATHENFECIQECVNKLRGEIQALTGEEGSQQLEAKPRVEVEERVIARIRERREAGRKNYGKTMERGDLSPAEWRRHLLEEVLDSLIYEEKEISLGELLDG